MADPRERLPQAVIVSNPTQPYLALRYSRPKALPDITARDAVTIASGGGRRFLRLRVELRE